MSKCPPDMNEALSPEEFQSRMPVWEALADFWLDTEIVEHGFDYIARIIAESPYSMTEIRDIHDYEVVPAVAGNLACVAGEWAGFDSAWLAAKCQAYALQRHSPWFRFRIRLQRLLLRSYTERYWRQVIPRVRALRSK